MAVKQYQCWRVTVDTAYPDSREYQVETITVASASRDALVVQRTLQEHFLAEDRRGKEWRQTTIAAMKPDGLVWIVED